MVEFLGTFIRLLLTAIFFGILAFAGVKIGIALRIKKNKEEELKNNNSN